MRRPPRPRTDGSGRVQATYESTENVEADSPRTKPSASRTISEMSDAGRAKVATAVPPASSSVTVTRVAASNSRSSLARVGFPRLLVRIAPAGTATRFPVTGAVIWRPSANA